MIRGIHHVSIHVHNFDRMMAFYREAFGFERVGDEFSWKNEPVVDTLIDVPGSAARGVMLRAGSCYVEMFEFQAPQGSTTPLNPYDKGYTHFCVDVASDIEGEYERLKALGMTFGAPAPIDMGHVKSVYGRDPEGNLIELQQTADHCEFRLDALPPVV